MDSTVNDDRQKSRLSPDEELAILEREAQAIRAKLRAIEEQEARLRSQKAHQTDTEEAVNEKQVTGQEEAVNEQETGQEESNQESSHTSCSPENGASIHGSDLLMDPVVDEDSLDRELKGLD